MAFKAKQIVSYFTAVVVFVILLLVSYSLKVVPRTQDFSTFHTERSLEIKRKHVQVAKPKHSHALKFMPDFQSQPKSSFIRFPQSKLQKDDPVPILEQDVAMEPTANCNDGHCTEYLEGEDQERFFKCENSARNLSADQFISGKCHFLDYKDRDPVALASFPGSGNTWLRGLLEEITGLCTGAVYCDVSLRSNGFAGEFIRSGSVLVVKTHRVTPIWTGRKWPRKLRDSEGQFESAIFLVRDPFKALVAEWNRKVANDFKERTIHLDTHVKSAGQEWFGENAQWSEFVYTYAQRWYSMFSNWVYKNQKRPLLVMKYERLKDDTVVEMQRIVEFLNIPLDEGELQKRINQGFSKFHRSHNSEGFEHFTRKQRNWVNSAITNASNLLDTLNFDDYLQPAR